LFYNIWLPSLVGGDVVRSGLLASETRNLPASITAVAADRITDLASLLVLAVIGVVLLPGAYAGNMVSGIAAAAVVLTTLVIALTVAIKAVNPGRLPSRLRGPLDGLKDAVDAMLRRKAATTAAVFTSTAVQAFFIFQNALIAHALGIHVPVAVWFIAFPAAKLVAFLPVSLGGLGLREGVVAAMLLPFSVPATLAVAQSLVWQTVTFATALAGGVAALWMGLLPWGLKKVKRIDNLRRRS
jgi:uncharacterized membrane protein YbhN (UPF0104 family)